MIKEKKKKKRKARAVRAERGSSFCDSLPQLGELQSAYEGAKKMAHQLKRKCRHLTCDLEDTRLQLEDQQSRSHELEKKQKK